MTVAHSSTVERRPLDADSGSTPQATPDMEAVDPLEQLAMSLAWEEDYTDEYKRRVLYEAIKYVLDKP